MYNGIIKHISPPAEIIITVKALITTRESLNKYENKDKFFGFCKDGCKNFSKYWSCPPFSPSFSKFAEGYENVLIVLYYSRLNQFRYLKSKDELISESHNFLKSEIDKLMYSLEAAYDGVSILNGHCCLCDICTCEASHSCKNPHKMRYSMESLGLDVEEISLDFFQHKIAWYINDEMPEHSTILSCFLTNNEIDDTSFMPLSPAF
jgi:predicted metal-binding protein